MEKKRKQNRWNSCNEVTVTRSSEEEISTLKKEAFKKLETFMKNGNKRKD